MPTSNQAHTFLELLPDDLDADRLIERAILALQHKQRAEHFLQLCRSDLDQDLQSLEPLERVRHPMPEQRRRTG